jgi:hypothetical protein
MPSVPSLARRSEATYLFHSFGRFGPPTVEGATLERPLGSTLGLVGGPVTINGGTLRAPAGTTHVAGAARLDEIPVDPRAGRCPPRRPLRWCG